jgi:hypothetical protein
MASLLIALSKSEKSFRARVKLDWSKTAAIRTL